MYFSCNFFLGELSLVYIYILKIMKKAAVIGFMLAIAMLSAAQEREYQTLVDFNDVRISGLGGPFMQFTTVNGSFAHMMGGGGAILLGDFFIGGYGLGLTNNIPLDQNVIPDARDYENYSISHGGFWLGYSLFGERPIHVSFSTLLGWGQIGRRGTDYYEVPLTNTFVVSPTVELELNLTRFFRLGMGATYNLYTLVAEPLRASDFSAPGGFLSFKFGWF